MSNIQVTHHTDPNNARSESNIAINPNNSMQIVAASKKFINYQTYDFTLATSYSIDGGQTWANSEELQINFPGWFGISDPALAWDDSGNIFLVALPLASPPPHNDNLTKGIAIYRSTNGGRTWETPQLIYESSSADKQWAAGDSNNGNVYVVWDDGIDMRFARTIDHGARWIGAGAGTTPPGTVLANNPNNVKAPEINVAANGDIYIVWIFRNEIKMIVSTDGGDSFNEAVPPATGIKPLGYPLPSVDGWTVLPGGSFRVNTLPTACVFGQMVAVAWADIRDGPSRIYYALSNNGGANWITGEHGAPLLTGILPADMHHFHPQIVTDPNGVIGCAFYEFGPKPATPRIDVVMAQSFDGGATFNHFTVTDQPWDPATIDAPWSHGNYAVTFIGDYFGLDASDRGFYPLWTDTRTNLQELWTAIVPEKKCAFILNRNPIGQDEVDARRRQPSGSSGGLPIQDAFRVVVDGFTASELGLTGPGSTLNVPSSTAGITITPHTPANVSENGGYGSEVQRFTFFYNIDFDPGDTAFNFSTETRDLMLNVTAGGVNASALLTLIKQPDPFLLHGDPAWLSIDLRVFAVRPNERWFGMTMDANVAANPKRIAPRFIQDVMKALTDGHGTAGGQSFDDHIVLSPDEDRSKLYLQPTDENHAPVFNFALARVRYIGSIGAANVRAFFRLRQTQVTYAAYDYPPGRQYRRAPSNPDGQPIPLAGIQNGEYVTVPCFALPRVDSTAVPMGRQTDSGVDNFGNILGNVQRITPHTDGSEVDTFFGCWIDINQPDARLPVEVPPPPNQDGPFDLLDPNLNFRPVSLKQALARNLHLCLIAEIAFDPSPIPVGKDPSNWSKLAQRNIAWSDTGSAQAVTTFEIRPTPEIVFDSRVGLPPSQIHDELMIDWGNTPTGSTAQIYLPAVNMRDILALANRMYTSHRLTRVDDYTLQCQTGGITYIPIPAGANVNYAGLLSVDLPDHLRRGDSYTVVVQQVTNAFGKILQPLQQPKTRRKAKAATSVKVEEVQWRRVLGAFQLTIPVKSKQKLLVTEERDLSVLRWIGEAIPRHNRWYPVFRRYLEQIAGRVKAFGGDPTQILPSPTGDGRRKHPDSEEHEERLAFTGKITSLMFDHFGDFYGFLLDTEDGERKFFSREKDMEQLAERAWQERLRLTVWVERDELHRPLSIIVHEPPAQFGR